MDFQTVLNSRKFDRLRVVRGVNVIDRSKNLFNDFVEDVLDQLFIERLLEDGKCCVCQAKTSKCCSNCGTHYCSSACQRSDWLSHKITCLGSQLKSEADSISKKPAQLESASVDHMCKDSKADVKSKFYKSTDTEAENTSSSFQDVSDIGVRNTGGYESDTDTGTEKSKRVMPRNYNKKYLKFKQKKTSEKAQSDKETNDSTAKEKENTTKFDKKNDWKKFVPGQKIMVKRMSSFKSNYWVIDKRDAEKFEEIQKRLECEWKTYAEASDTTSNLFALRYNQKWHRCKAFSQGPKTLVRCVDTGNIFLPKHLAALELPDDLKTGNALAFQVLFEDTSLPEDDVEWLNVRVVKMLPKGIYSVKLEEKKKKEPKKKSSESSEGEKKKKMEKSGSENENWMEESLTEREDTKPRKSVFDEPLKPTAKGTFLPGKIGKGELLGCLTPDDIDEAMCCYNKITGLYIEDGNKIDANVGDDVMVAGDDTIGRRGVVKSKSDDKYKVQLVDYGYTVETNEVYRMPEKTADMIHLACRVTLLDNPPRRYDEFEVKRAYEFEVMEKKAKGDWLCKFAIYPDLNEAFAYGIVTRPWKRRPRKNNYVPFENGCEVVLTWVGISNDVHIKHVDGEWDELLEKLNLKLNQYAMDTVSDLSVDDVQVGDILLCQYKQDELWYRAKVLNRRKDQLKVVFVDYGNVQFSTESELRSMPEGVDEPFFSRKVKLVGSSNFFSAKGKEYLLGVKNDNQTLILSYKDKDMSEGVILFSEDGTNINEIAFGQEEPPAEDTNEDMNMNSSYAGFDKEKFLKSEGFNLGLVENFVCLSLDKASFRKEGVFWAVNPESSNFKYIIELDSKLSKYCESDSENISAETGMLCIAEYQGGWYRGLILDIFGPLVEVFFVDFGNTQILERKCIRKMVPEFFEVPATAVKCVLNGHCWQGELYLITHISRMQVLPVPNPLWEMCSPQPTRKSSPNRHPKTVPGLDKNVAIPIQRVETFISENLNKTLKNTAVVVNVVDNAHYVEFRNMI